MRRVLALMVAVAMAAGCASPGSRVVAPPEAPLLAPCRPTGPVRPSPTLAVLVSPQGEVCWQHPLPPVNIGSQPQPVVSDTLAYLAAGAQVEAVSLRDGRLIWTWSGHPTGGLAGVDPYALGLDGMWLGGGVLAVSDAGTLIGLDAETGSKRWTLTGLIGPQGSVVTHGGVAMSANGAAITMIDLATGHVRWSAPKVTFSAVGAGVVLVASGDRLEALDDQTGKRRWTWTSPSGPFGVRIDQGLALVRYVQSPVLIAVDLGDGGERWRFSANLGVWPSVTGAAGIAVEVGQYSMTTEMDLLDPQTGRALWHQPSPPLSTPVLSGHDLVGIQAGWSNEPVRLVDRSTDDGTVRWQRSIPQPSSTSGFGPFVIVRPLPASIFHGPLVAYRLADGAEAWQLDLAGDQVATTIEVPGGLLVEAATAGNLASQGH